MPERLEKFRLQRLVLALQVEHGNGNRSGIRGFCHGNMVAAKPSSSSRKGFQPRLRRGKFGPAQLKKVGEALYCCHIAGFGCSGTSGTVPADLSYHTDAER